VVRGISRALAAAAKNFRVKQRSEIAKQKEEEDETA
jgi:hypothetical protein